MNEDAKTKFPPIELSAPEKLSVSLAIGAGVNYGFGNLMAWLGAAWAQQLINGGLDRDTAIKHVSNRTPYPIEWLEKLR